MNLVIGDYIEFTLPQFEGGSFSTFGGRRGGSKGRHVGDKAFCGTIERDWYDVNRRHWFSVRLKNTGKLKRAQGKNLYPGITLHQHGEDHATASQEKSFRRSLA